MKYFLQTLFISLVASFLTIANANVLSQETLTSLATKVENLRKSIANSNALVEDSRGKISELEYVSKNAPAVTDKMLQDLDKLIIAFNTKSEYFNTIQEARTDIREKINLFREGSPAQKDAANILNITLKKFNKVDKRRDDLVGRALASKRALMNQKEDLSALLVAGAYKKMVGLFEKMMDGFEDTVNHAEEVNKSLIDASGLDRQ